MPVKAELEAEVAALGARLQAEGLGRWRCAGRRCGRLHARFLRSTSLLALPRRRFDEAAAGLGRGLSLNTLNKRRSFESGWPACAAGGNLETNLVRRRQRVADAVTRADRSTDKAGDPAPARALPDLPPRCAPFRRASKARSAASMIACAASMRAARPRWQPS